MQFMIEPWGKDEPKMEMEAKTKKAVGSHATHSELKIKDTSLESSSLAVFAASESTEGSAQAVDINTGSPNGLKRKFEKFNIPG